MSKFEPQPYWTELYNTNETFRGRINLWGWAVVFLILISWIFTLPLWAETIASLNIAFWLLIASMKVYRIFLGRIFLFLVGFFNLVLALSQLKELLF